MKTALKTGFSFGLTSGVITTLGLMVGLQSGTHSKLAVVGGILTIAIADAFSDALGIHVSQESQDGISAKKIWMATLATFLSKFVFAITFVIPILLLSLGQAVVVSVFWGFFLLSVFSYYLAKQRKENPSRLIAEHLIIGLLVVLATYLLGTWIDKVFS